HQHPCRGQGRQRDAFPAGTLHAGAGARVHQRRRAHGSDAGIAAPAQAPPEGTRAQERRAPRRLSIDYGTCLLDRMRCGGQCEAGAPRAENPENVMRRTVVSVVTLASFLAATLLAPVAQAGIISTEAYVSEVQADAKRDEVMALMQR